LQLIDTYGTRLVVGLLKNKKYTAHIIFPITERIRKGI